jgi:hypothetical protein
MKITRGLSVSGEAAPRLTLWNEGSRSLGGGVKIFKGGQTQESLAELPAQISLPVPISVGHACFGLFKPSVSSQIVVEQRISILIRRARVGDLR